MRKTRTLPSWLVCVLLLLGASLALVNCGNPHASGNAGPWPATCISCHQWDYDHATNPAHAGVLPVTCEDCHEMSGWIPARGFDHSIYPLTGAHLQASCAACHGDPPQYQGIATECVGCHRANYDASPYPGHNQFALTCQDCHTTTAWVPASGGTHPEARFPITWGPHRDIACADCHDTNVSSVWATNSNCIQCHTRSHMDRAHGEARRYAWDAANPDFCLECHPTGTGGGDD
jgi:nitrate/TMAO reductase-like tetraheme cytochrome c subunit